MRSVIQRVRQASVSINEEKISEIKQGLLIFLGVGKSDTHNEINWMINKLIHLRIFDDGHGKMNKSVQEIDGEILVVSQFTLYGDCSKGRRPSFIKSASLDIAKKIYDFFVDELRKKYDKVKTGVFQADMKIDLINEGPVTFIIDTK